MPKQVGYVPINSRKYEQWQMLAYAGSHDETWFKLECELYERWLASQPPVVERQPYTWPTSILQKLDEYSSDGDDSLSQQDEQWSMESVARSVDSTTDGSPIGDDPVSAAVALGASTPTPTEGPDVNQECDNSPTETQSEGKSPDAAVADLEHNSLQSTEGNDDPADDDYAVHQANYISLEDYAQELAFLPDLTEPSVTELDYTAPNVKNPSFRDDQQRRLDEVLKNHESIMISSGNALPPPAYGVVCGIDVQEHAPIKQRARRNPLRHLQMLYELRKGLVKAGLITFSDSPWASSIVIVLKKNGQDIRLCIDYKIDSNHGVRHASSRRLVDRAGKLRVVLCVGCRKWVLAVMMTMRACKISAFIWALGHFESLRMPFGLKNALMIYQRMIDNALWGFVQPKGGWERYAERMKLTEEAAKHQRSLDDDSDFTLTTTRTKFEADRQASSELDPVFERTMRRHPDESLLVLVFQRRSFVDDICFGGTTFDDCLDTLDKLLARFEECRISVSFTKSIVCQSKIDFLSHEVSPEGIRAGPKKMTTITKLPFPKSKTGMQQFLGSLNYYSRFIQDFAVYGAALYYQLKEADFFKGGDLAATKESFTALQRKVAEAPILRHFDAKKEVHIMLYANEWTLSSTLM
ncbi:hypothetical protein PHMEG_0008947 [Phytophthora megakarya]|uniref:Reverse transcriptase n=1 Tax=Phytophthora megakarya TaxID=4795 RepID=A0A225WI93_9STRA|nr:hypothetical protein PHMEG_0008947 [Phytophthora megakarya]